MKVKIGQKFFDIEYASVSRSLSKTMVIGLLNSMKYKVSRQNLEHLFYYLVTGDVGVFKLELPQAELRDNHPYAKDLRYWKDHKSIVFLPPSNGVVALGFAEGEVDPYALLNDVGSLRSVISKGVSGKVIITKEAGEEGFLLKPGSGNVFEILSTDINPLSKGGTDFGQEEINAAFALEGQKVYARFSVNGYPVVIDKTCRCLERKKGTSFRVSEERGSIVFLDEGEKVIPLVNAIAVLTKPGYKICATTPMYAKLIGLASLIVGGVHEVGGRLVSKIDQRCCVPLKRNLKEMFLEFLRSHAHGHRQVPITVVPESLIKLLSFDIPKKSVYYSLPPKGEPVPKKDYDSTRVHQVVSFTSRSVTLDFSVPTLVVSACHKMRLDSFFKFVVLGGYRDVIADIDLVDFTKNLISFKVSDEIEFNNDSIEVVTRRSGCIGFSGSEGIGKTMNLSAVARFNNTIPYCTAMGSEYYLTNPSFCTSDPIRSIEMGLVMIVEDHNHFLNSICSLAPLSYVPSDNNVSDYQMLELDKISLPEGLYADQYIEGDSMIKEAFSKSRCDCIANSPAILSSIQEQISQVHIRMPVSIGRWWTYCGVSGRGDSLENDKINGWTISSGTVASMLDAMVIYLRRRNSGLDLEKGYRLALFYIYAINHQFARDDYKIDIRDERE